jgi:hypothetical protein
MLKEGTSLAADFLQSNLESSVVIFCNSHKQSIHVSGQLEKKLDQVKLSVDVVNINGSGVFEYSVTIAIIGRAAFVPSCQPMHPTLVSTSIPSHFRYILNGHTIS